MDKNILFLLKFFVIFGLLQGIILVAPLNPLNEWIAGMQAGALSLERDGIAVLAKGARFLITNSCTGLVSGSILAAIVFSLRKPVLKQKTVIFLIGALSLFLINLVRVYFVILSGLAFGAGFAGMLHVASWFFMSGFIIALWYYLTKKLAKIRDFSELL